MSGHVVLIGLSGTGKSSVGRLLAGQMARPLYDTDAVLSERAGMTVPQLLRRDEALFRRLEEEVIRDVCAAPPGVVATGGGAVLSARNRALLLAGNHVIWLRAPVAVLAQRLRSGEDRPLLSGDSFARLAALEVERAALYQACAHVTLETDGFTPREVARRVATIVAAEELARG